MKSQAEIYQALLDGKKISWKYNEMHYLHLVEHYLHLVDGMLCDDKGLRRGCSFNNPSEFRIYEEPKVAWLTPNDVGNALKFENGDVSIIFHWCNENTSADCGGPHLVREATHVKRNGEWVKLG